MSPPALKKILVIPLRYIGDTVLSVPLIRNLRASYPQATIDLLASPATVSLMEPCPYLNRVIVEERKPAAFLRWLRSERYDGVILLRKSVTMALMCRLAGIPVVAGYDKQRYPWGYKRWGRFLTHTARYPSLKTDTPQALSHLEVLKALGIPVQDDHLELWTTPDDENRLQIVLDEMNIQLSPAGKPVAIVHAASASHGKQIAIEKFADSVAQLFLAGYQVLATGIAADSPLYERLIRNFGLPIANLAGKTSLRETVALYRKADLLLSVDSSPIHMGAAAGIPRIVGVFGPTNERQWGAHAHTNFRPVFMDLPCRPCYAKICEHNNCRVTLTSAQITGALQSALETRKGTP